jgi:hypothetical protein
MRKKIALLVSVFALALGVGALLPQANAAFSPCTLQVHLQRARTSAAR